MKINDGFEKWWKELQDCSIVSGVSYPYPKSEVEAIWKAGYFQCRKTVLRWVLEKCNGNRWLNRNGIIEFIERELEGMKNEDK